MHLDLDPREARALEDLVSRRLEDIQRELHHTDSRAFRTKLKTEADRLEVLLGRLLELAVPGAP